MKKLYYIFFILLHIIIFYETSQSSEKNTKANFLENNIYKNKFNEYDKKIEKILQQQTFLIKENQLFKTTIDTNTNIFNGVSSYFTIVTILLTIIVIAIPVIRKN